MKQFNVAVMGNITVEADTLADAIKKVQETLVGNDAIGVDPQEILSSLQILTGDSYEL
jgi:hypothetical protein